MGAGLPWLPTEMCLSHLPTKTGLSRLPTETGLSWLPTETGLSRLPTETGLLAAHPDRSVFGCPPSCLGCPLKTSLSQLSLRQASLSCRLRQAWLLTETGLAAN
ncbi:hypothetical protein PCANC_02041 [Puccinia coronata f. sp. avenae]|uniref:Uncharacterized protein n=1 Tax=Puccinia coronata f. sp. avenae TaxID=200324 RepID=A0A2N5W217_9BASI|nr:hypothetical protein PCANC_21257 [Puccinia coronata f. sp. avenae]PLW11856.1 hypothetical protein PCANC_22249 [Puccinia coronata f. sp. avenae]PLW48444.1 hypothetical protein PCANC_10232 [Puccinia coronata f. sp. avenae]PLW54716.1 hypothetical protein PCANC_11679 [Puccinia coronata f. sp. avenae]PLW56252.1 hypothetical protein PCANC_02041 [Puccinia coronata f. sp. avenae]